MFADSHRTLTKPSASEMSSEDRAGLAVRYLRVEGEWEVRQDKRRWSFAREGIFSRNQPLARGL